MSDPYLPEPEPQPEITGPVTVTFTEGQLEIIRDGRAADCAEVVYAALGREGFKIP